MIKLFTHNDFDGVGCYIMAVMSYGKENVDVTYCDYTNINENVHDYINSGKWKEYDMCYITDISVNLDTVYLMESNTMDRFSHFTLIDHHATAMWLNDRCWCTVRTHKDGELTCGTELFAQHLYKQGRLSKSACTDMFVMIVRDYDTWKWTTYDGGDRCSKFNDLLYMYGKEEFASTIIERIERGTIGGFTETDTILLRFRERDIKEYIERKSKTLIKIDILGYKAGVVFADTYISQLGGKLSEDNPDLDFVAVVRCDKSVSYRTCKDNIDLGKDVASVFGGGGHAKSSGSTISDEIKYDIIRSIFKEKIKDETL